MSTLIFDGNYSTAQIADQPDWEIPFKEDPKPYSYKLKYWQYLNNYADITWGDDGPLGGTYVGLTPGSFKSIGGGIVEFSREFALVPDTRNEPESFVYPFQIIFTDGSITEMPYVTSSRIQYDYFKTDTPTEIDLPRAPKAFTAASVTYLLNGMLDLVLPYPGAATGTEVLAQDASFKRWKGNIYERQQRFIRWIGLTDLFASAFA